MVYLVETRFKAGIYLSAAKIKYDLKNIYSISKYDEYSDAEATLKKLIADGDMSFTLDKVKPNRLYQIRSNKIYNVVYTRSKAGFIDDNQLDNFLTRNGLNGKDYIIVKNMTYDAALSYTLKLNPITGSSEISASKPVKCGGFYNRQGYSS